MKNWMHYLATHYENMRQKYPDDKLLVLFDIDGTILDLRYRIYYLLKKYDQTFNKNYFSHLQIGDIFFHEDDLAEGLKYLQIEKSQIAAIVSWYNNFRWSLFSIFEASKPFPGVLDVIRWFQLQPKTYIGLNTGRTEILREDTLESLNNLGREYRVRFDDHLLKMKPASDCINDPDNKVSAILEYKEMGYRVTAMIDNEITNLEKIAEADIGDEVMLLHARTLFRINERKNSIQAYQGNIYDLTELIPRRSLPKHLQFVWSNINNETSLHRFLESNVHWGDITSTAYALSGKSMRQVNENYQFMQYLSKFIKAGKGVRISLLTTPELDDLIVDLLVESSIESGQLWLNAKVDDLKKEAFMFYSDVFPEAIIECPVDYLIPVMLSTPDKAEHILDTYVYWGVNRFSLSWHSPNVKKALSILDNLGFETTVYDVSNLEEFLQVILFQPTAIVTDFNYPKWDKAYYDDKVTTINAQAN